MNVILELQPAEAIAAILAEGIEALTGVKGQTTPCAIEPSLLCSV